MAKTPKISDAEWQVMEAVWADHPVSAAEVMARIDGPDWSEATVKTLLGRLVKKGALRTRRDGKRYLYSPKVAREDLVREASESFVDRVFAGDASAFVAHFVKSGSLDAQQVAELRRLLEEGDS